MSLASQYFPDNFSVDLITGLPCHNEKIINDDIEKVLKFKPSHISLYSLTAEDDTFLKKKLKEKKIVLPELTDADSMWLFARDKLIDSGFDNYEVSNFAVNKKYCVHNMRYWQMKNWIGAGPCASGTIVNEDEGKAIRVTYEKDIEKYIKFPNINYAGLEELNSDLFLRDTLLMGFRCKEGPDNKLFKKRFGFNMEEAIPETLFNWKNKDKILFLNRFIEQAFEELDLKKDIAKI